MKKIYVLLSATCALVSAAQQHRTPDHFDVNGHYSEAAITAPLTPVNRNLTSPYSDTFTNVQPITELNTASGEAYPWISGDGLRLYFTQGNGSANQIKFAQRPDEDSPFGPASTISTNSPSNPLSIWLTPDELDAYVCGNLGASIFRLHRDTAGAAFGFPTGQSLAGSTATFQSGISFAPGENELYIYAISGTSFLRRYTRTSATSFSFVDAVPFDSGLVLAPGQLSRDGLDFFGSIGTESSKSLIQLSRNTLSDNFDGTGATPIASLVDDSTQHSFQASVSNNNRWIVFVRSNDNTFGGNDLYIAKNTELGVSQQSVSGFAMYPNPTTGWVQFDWNGASQGKTVSVYNATGQLLLTQSAIDRLDLSGYAKGIYLVTVTGAGFSESRKLVLQ